MNQEKITKTFHDLYNILSNISLAAQVNIIRLKKEELDGLSNNELKQRFSHLLEDMAKIEDNAKLLNKALEEFQKLLTAKGDITEC